MSDDPAEKNGKSGCVVIILVVVVAGYLFRGCFSPSVDVVDFAGAWKASSQEYNPFSLGGVIEKGYYPVEYNLEINTDGKYKLYYGSPGFLKLERTGILKSTKSGLIFTSFDLSESKNDHDIQNIIVNDKRIESFCTHALGSVIDGCHIEFHK